jgi:hypothetical protein
MRANLLLQFFFLLNICNAQTIYEVKARVFGDYNEISCSLAGPACSLACAMGWTLSASSVLPDNGTINYSAENMNDGLETTAWAEGAKGLGIGEKIFARVSCDSKTHNVSFWGIRIANGYQKDSSIWKANSRIKSLKVYQNAKPFLIIHLQDQMGVQRVKWRPDIMKLNNGDLITFEITEVYKGDKYEDVAVSDLVLDGAH